MWQNLNRDGNDDERVVELLNLCWHRLLGVISKKKKLIFWRDFLKNVWSTNKKTYLER